MLELVKEINQRDLLNTLTDAGLIPNYAFPEAGHRAEVGAVAAQGVGRPRRRARTSRCRRIRYERPASSALSEFAPENRFYANQRRVEIDQINMGLAKLEWWRLCPGCHHMENLTVHADAHPDMSALRRRNVARSGSAATAAALPPGDREQRRHRVRIDDSADDREPKFYVRQLLADFEGRRHQGSLASERRRTCRSGSSSSPVSRSAT